MVNVNDSDLLRLVDDLGDDLIGSIQQVLESDGTNFTGELSASIHKEHSHVIAVDSPYSIPVEYGMPVGTRVNYDALRFWVENKLGIKDEETAKDVTMKIFKKIESHGIPAKRPVKKGILNLVKNKSHKKPKKNSRNRGNKHIRKILRNLRKINRHLRKISKYIKTAKKVISYK